MEVLSFQSAVFRVLNGFSLLERNLGLCISHLKDPTDPASSYEMLQRLSCAGKIKTLRELLDPEMVDVFDAWAESAVSQRAIRNQFAHGCWEYLPLRKESPVGLRLPPWAGDQGFEFSVRALQEIADALESCFHDFMQWRKEHGV